MLVGGFSPTPLKNIGMMKFPYIYIYVESHKIPWFQTTNQIKHVSHIIFKQLLDFTKTNTIKPYKPWKSFG
jgi:hypothetical protein